MMVVGCLCRSMGGDGSWLSVQVMGGDGSWLSVQVNGR